METIRRIESFGQWRNTGCEPGWRFRRHATSARAHSHGNIASLIECVTKRIVIIVLLQAAVKRSQKASTPEHTSRERERDAMCLQTRTVGFVPARAARLHLFRQWADELAGRERKRRSRTSARTSNRKSYSSRTSRKSCDVLPIRCDTLSGRVSCMPTRPNVASDLSIQRCYPAQCP
jgi:hypothetical protein